MAEPTLKDKLPPLAKADGPAPARAQTNPFAEPDSAPVPTAPAEKEGTATAVVPDKPDKPEMNAAESAAYNAFFGNMLVFGVAAIALAALAARGNKAVKNVGALLTLAICMGIATVGYFILKATYSAELWTRGPSIIELIRCFMWGVLLPGLAIALHQLLPSKRNDKMKFVAAYIFSALSMAALAFSQMPELVVGLPLILGGLSLLLASGSTLALITIFFSLPELSDRLRIHGIRVFCVILMVVPVLYALVAVGFTLGGGPAIEHIAFNVLDLVGLLTLCAMGVHAAHRHNVATDDAGEAGKRPAVAPPKRREEGGVGKPAVLPPQAKKATAKKAAAVPSPPAGKPKAPAAKPASGPPKKKPKSAPGASAAGEPASEASGDEVAKSKKPAAKPKPKAKPVSNPN